MTELTPDVPAKEPEEAVGAPETPAEAPVGDTPAEEPAEAPAGQDAPQTDDLTNTVPPDNVPPVPAESDVERLKRELADAEAAEAAKVKTDAIAAGSEPCPTCGSNPPGTDQENAREIWCPTCGAKLENLPAGH